MNNIIKTDHANENVLELRLSVLVYQQGDYFVALAPALDLSSYGNTVQDAKEGFDDVIREYIEHCQKYNTLQKDLTSHGWRIVNPCDIEPPSEVSLEIPGGMLKKQFNESYRIPVC